MDLYNTVNSRIARSFAKTGVGVASIGTSQQWYSICRRAQALLAQNGSGATYGQRMALDHRVIKVAENCCGQVVCHEAYRYAAQRIPTL